MLIKRLILPSLLVVLIISSVCFAVARDMKIRAGISGGFEFYDRRYKNDDGVDQSEIDGEVTLTEDSTSLQDDDYNRFRLTPVIDITSATARDEITFRYAPSLRYDYDTYERDIDHNLSASYDRLITSRWQLTLSEAFHLRDMVEDDFGITAGADDPEQISDNGGRRKFWTNNLRFGSEYTYWGNSVFSIGYDYGILENIDTDIFSGYENYDRHEATLSVAHQFDSIWRTTVSGRYVRGLYEPAGRVEEVVLATLNDNDLNEYQLITMLESSFIEHHPLSLSYSYTEANYDDLDRDDSAIHDVTLGWQWSVTKLFAASLGGGPSYLDIDGVDGKWGYNGNITLLYEMERGLLQFTAKRGYEYQHFSGDNENGLREYWESRLDYNYRIFESLSFSIYSSYRDEDREELSAFSRIADIDITEDDDSSSLETINRKRFIVGTGLSYLFDRFFSVTLSYNYVIQESERIRDDYDEHRLDLLLSYNRDLFSW